MDNKEEKEFEGLLGIDKTQLDEEAENQPYLVWDYGRHYAKAVKAMDTAKAKLKVVEAEIDIEVRDSPGDFDLDPSKKPSEYRLFHSFLDSLGGTRVYHSIRGNVANNRVIRFNLVNELPRLLCRCSFFYRNGVCVAV